MINFVIEKIKLRNVRNYGDDGMEMDFPLGKVTVFTGKVGAGKSTILKAVSMALYGEDGGVKNEKLSIDDMVNERVGKNLEIHLFFTGTDTITNVCDKYEVHLYHKHSKMNNKLVFIKNGKDISANGKMDTYRLIEKTIIPKEVYHNIYYFTQQAKNFFTALPNSEQKAIFDSILDLSDYDKYYDNCREKIKEYEQKLDQCELQIKMIENNISEKSGMINHEKENIENLKKINQEEIEKLKIDIESCNKKIKEFESDKDLFGDSSYFDKKINETKSKSEIRLNNINNEINSLNLQIGNIKEKYQKLFSEFKLKVKEELDEVNEPVKYDIKKLEEDLNNENHKYEKSKSDLVNDTNNSKLVLNKEFDEKILILKQEIKSLETEILSEKDRVRNNYLSKQQEVNSKVTEITKNQSEFRIKKENITKDISHIKQLINDLENRYKSNSKQLNSDTPICDKCGQPLINLDRLKEEQKVLEKDINEKTSNISNLNNDIVDIDKKIKDLENDINDCNSDLEKYKTEKLTQYKEKKDQFDKKRIEKNSQLENLETDKESKLKEIDSIHSTKLNMIENDHSKNVDKIENDIKAKNDCIELNTNSAKNKLITTSQEYNKNISKECEDINNSISSKESEKLDIQKKTSCAIQELEFQLKQSKTVEQGIQTVKDELHRKQSEYKIKEDFHVSDETLHSLEKSINEDETKLKDFKATKNDLDKTLKILEFWKTAFSDSGIKSMLIDVAIPHMNQCVRDELDRVCPGVFTVSFDTLSETKSGTIRDKFSINIVHNIKCATGHKKLSGGEKRIIDFCCMAALRSLAEKLYGKRFSHIFYDEVFDALDSESRELFAQSMKIQSEDNRSITLVTHALTEDFEPDRVFPF